MQHWSCLSISWLDTVAEVNLFGGCWRKCSPSREKTLTFRCSPYLLWNQFLFINKVIVPIVLIYPTIFLHTVTLLRKKQKKIDRLKTREDLMIWPPCQEKKYGLLWCRQTFINRVPNERSHLELSLDLKKVLSSDQFWPSSNSITGFSKRPSLEDPMKKLDSFGALALALAFA